MRYMELESIIKTVAAEKKVNVCFSDMIDKKKLAKERVEGKVICVMDGKIFTEEYVTEESQKKKENIRINYDEMMLACIPWFLTERKEHTKVFVVTNDNNTYVLPFSTKENAECFIGVLDSIIKTMHGFVNRQDELDYYYSKIKKNLRGICKIGAIEKVRILSNNNSGLIIPDNFQQYLYYRDTFEGYWYFAKNRGRIKSTRKFTEYEQLKELYDEVLRRIKEAEDNNVYEAYANHINYFLVLNDYAKKERVKIADNYIRDFGIFCEVYYEKIRSNVLDFGYSSIFPNEYQIDENEIFRVGWRLGTVFYQNQQLKDRERAKKWLEYALTSKTADLHPQYADVLYLYTMCIREADEQEYDEDSIIKNLKEAANKGHGLSEYELSQLYREKGEDKLADDFKKRAQKHGIKNNKEYLEAKLHNMEINIDDILFKLDGAVKIIESVSDIAEAVIKFVGIVKTKKHPKKVNRKLIRVR